MKVAHRIQHHRPTMHEHLSTLHSIFSFFYIHFLWMILDIYDEAPNFLRQRETRSLLRVAIAVVKESHK